MRCIERLAATALILALPVAAQAADEELLTDPQLLEDGQALWLLTAGAEADSDGGYYIDGSAALSLHQKTAFTLHASHSDASTRSDQLTASAVDLAFDQGFERWGFSLSAGYWKDPDLVATSDLGGALSLKWQGWRFMALAEKRASDFNSFAVNGVIPRPNLPPIAVTGTAACDLDGVAFGGRISFTGKRWGGYLAGKDYDYDDFACRFSSLAIGGVDVRTDRLRAVSPAFLRRLTLRATAAGFASLHEDTVFLESSLSAGVSTVRGTRTYALDYLHTQELIDRLDSDTLVGSLTFSMSRRTDLEVHVGIFDSEQADTVGFAGVTLIAYLGG
ncbi:MAG TPA: hypothetical protein VE046_17585 [Steroidobacteraceae bacterium]|nr:hypothetical protein [Steroidobacteraceae bacterium]